MAQNKKQDVDKAIASINTGVEKKEEMRLMMAPYANWDSFLLPTPLSITLLGQLILISSDADFSLQNKKEYIKFEHLKYPDSFRACLVQVSNKGWDAFNKAHSSMDQIRLLSSNVDIHVKTAVRFLIAGSVEDVESTVPNALRNIERIADDCLDLSTSVEEEFVAVMKMIAELLEACTRAKGQHENDLKAAKIAREVAENHYKAINAEKQQSLSRRKKLEKQMNDADEEFKDAIKSMPGTWDIIGKACVDILIGVARTTNAIPNMVLGKRGLNTGSNEDAGSNSNRQNIPEWILDIFKIMPVVHGHVQTLLTLVIGGAITKGDERAKTAVLRMKRSIESIKESGLEVVNRSQMKTKVMKLCGDAINLCDALISSKQRLQGSEEEIQEFKLKAEKLLDEANALLAASHFVLGDNALPNTPPNLAKQSAYNSSGGINSPLVQQTFENYRFRTETAKEMLKDSCRAYEKSCDDVERKTREVTNLLVKMKELDLKEMDMEKIRQTLVRGIQALGEVREQWGKLVEFFQMLSNIVKCCLDTSLKFFVQTSRSRLAQGDSDMSAAMRDSIFEQAFQANQIAYVVNSISSVYVQVSHKHLMEPISGLGKLIALDPTSSKHEIRAKQHELTRGCKEGQEAIRRITLSKKREMTEALGKRVKRIENEVEALLPPISRKKAEKIKEKVKSNIAMSRADIEAQVNDLC